MGTAVRERRSTVQRSRAQSLCGVPGCSRLCPRGSPSSMNLTGRRLGRAEGLSCVTPLIPALASHHRFRQTQSSLRDAKHLCPYKLTSRRSLNGFASGAASPDPKAPTQPGRNFSVRWAKIPQLPPNSKRLLAKKSGLTFHFFCSAIQRHRQHSTAIGVCTTSVWKQCRKISLGALK